LQQFYLLDKAYSFLQCTMVSPL